ncbi:SWI/SNF complex subunit SWI3D-like [Primulina eburnea]|uniref:SWI/SNF complex subunit SWI3D-like n=1 Tax=Primulina eburnea TaxID=1245227 RepID=UPI003C6C86AB
MEEKRRDSTGTPPTAAIDDYTPASEPLTSSRRRGGAQKRKSVSINSGFGGTDPQATSSKRQAREKTPVVPFPPIHLNGPCTRARVQPNNGTSLSLDASDLKVESEAKAEELRRVSESWEELEAEIEAEYKAIISRDANAHVVPIHAGWFSWNKIHTLEERMMPSFFSGKLESRTPEIYMEIRNWIMKKFHFNPNSQIELEQLSKLTVGDLDARQEVMEFLDYWGLINYHPFPKNEPVASVTVDDDEARKKDSLIEKLFQFETVESWTPVVTKTNMEMPSMSSGLLPDSVIAEELNKSEGPSVGYHCNSCSTDCSRKRYHCQKQADFDLCAECFNNGKFGSDMSVSDFILMESAEAGGVSGGKWTDQETLLLLEAIELFRDNWSEIAEHVATKTKAQCILHFVQMPIGDVFFNSDDENDAIPKEIGLPVSIANENSSPKADHDTDTDVKDVTEKTENEGDATDNQASSSPMEIPKPEEVDDSDKSLEFMENFTQKALKDAFEAVGSLSSPGDKLSFAEAGNPVMALAAFLVRLVEPNIASASIHSFLKALSAKHSSQQLAARHCLPMEDPPDEKKNLADSEGVATETVEDETQKHGNEHVENQNEETPDSAVQGISIQDDDKEENKESSSEEYKEKKDASSEQKLAASTSSDKSEFPRKQSLKDAAASGVSGSHTQLKSNHVKESDNGGSAMELCQSEAPLKDKNLTSNSEKEDTEPFFMSDSATEKEKRTGDKEAKEHDGKKKNSLVAKNDLDINKLKRAAVTALSAAAVKSKLLADEEESQIRQLAILLVERQLHKLETKLALFGDLENVVLRVKEQLDRSKQRLFQERAQIIATRLGMPASARPTSHHLPSNRAPAPAPASNFPNQGLRPLMGTNTLRPPISRPTMAPNPASSTFMHINAAGSSMQPNSDKFSSFGAK